MCDLFHLKYRILKINFILQIQRELPNAFIKDIIQKPKSCGFKSVLHFSRCYDYIFTFFLVFVCADIWGNVWKQVIRIHRECARGVKEEEEELEILQFSPINMHFNTNKAGGQRAKLSFTMLLLFFIYMLKIYIIKHNNIIKMY